MKPLRTLLPVLFLSSVTPSLGAGEPVTYSGQVASIVNERCVSCHRPDAAAPFSLTTYQDVAKRGKLIAAVTQSRYMPPWKAEEASYPYRDSRRLSDAELATLQSWVKAGMPAGDLAKAPPPPKFADGWQLGKPDAVVEMTEGFRVPAEGADIYKNIVLPLNLPDVKWVRAIELRTSSRTVVHHVLYYADNADDAREMQAKEDPNANGMRFSPGMIPLGGVAVGAQPHLLPAGLALKLPKNSDLVFQYHFHPSGKEEVEKSQVGLYFAKDAPSHTLLPIQMPPVYSLFSGLDIPAGDKQFHLHDTYVIPADVKAVSVGAHAHYIGKTMKMTATFPDGAVKTLLDIRDWDFGWQDRYFFEDFVTLPKGTRLDCDITWDNSASNRRNPSSPPQRVTWGEQSKDEMGSVSLQVFPAQEADAQTVAQDIRKHAGQVIREGVMRDPGLLPRVRTLLGGKMPAGFGSGGGQ